MTLQMDNPLTAFQWKPQPQAQKLVRGMVDDFLSRTPAARELSRRMTEETGTRFFDWIDSIALPANRDTEAELVAAGYQSRPLDGQGKRLAHEGGIFPPIRFAGSRIEIAIKVESVVDFAAANNLPLKVEQPPLSLVRRLPVAEAQGTALWATERHGYRGENPPACNENRKLLLLKHAEQFRTRRRIFENDEDGFKEAHRLTDAAIADLGVDVTCDIFFAAEREYWQRKNRAAQFQKARQDRLGLGWANHDHHTYRSSRKYFARMIRFFEKLGFHCRERFYPGEGAGWGAQVIEQPNTGIIIFADVDISPHELMSDFAHEPLPERDKLNTVGLWCGLHGESFLEAGMHHLEAQFDFDALRQQMESQGGVKVMKPFTDFTYLRQAFTEGERWNVREERLAKLLTAKLITDDQAKQFRTQGAIGSHLENLERNEGFKGFNQTGVTEIINATDPRLHAVASR
jgi:hypothetical protein